MGTPLLYATYVLKGSFTRSISEADFALSLCVFQNEIIFLFMRMHKPYVKSTSRVNEP
jgi:hypothetical protein